MLKRNVLASFTNILLLPVTIVPRTVGAVGGALMTGGTAAVQGIAMLNPQRWVTGDGANNVARPAAYSKNLSSKDTNFFDDDDDDYSPKVNGGHENLPGL